MPTLLLIRHGANDFVGRRLAGRTPGVHLNERGRQQAETLAAILAKAPIKAVYSSPLERAVETAEPLARALGLTVQVCDGLTEVDFGRWVGKTARQMARTKLWKVVQWSPSQARFPAGESFTEAQGRIVAAIESILAAHADGDLVACVSHSDAIKLALAHYLGLPLDNFQRLHVDTASISVLHFPKDGFPRLAHLNQVLEFDLQRREKPRRRKPK
jgi:probable phosphomutase (TIGR03848 family)